MPPATLNPGQTVGQWTVEKKLGEGAFGAVYRVQGRNCAAALKVEGVNEQPQILKMEVSPVFGPWSSVCLSVRTRASRRQVAVLEELGRRGGLHVCQLYDKGRTTEFNWVAMTLVGQSLQDIRKAAPGQKLSLPSAIRVGMQCLEALRVGGAAGVVVKATADL